jgi:FHA domain
MTTLLALLLGAAALAAVGVFRWTANRRAARSRRLPPLFIPVTPVGQRDPLGLAEWRRAHAPQAVPPADAPRRGLADSRAPVDEIDEERRSPMETIRFVRPADEPVQLLPGRLEVLAGTTLHREIRFVRVAGKPLHLFVGRDAGPAPQYIGLGSPTVSRRHARFSYADGRWRVKNLSHTNPLVVNDDELSEMDDERPLVDGDRLELGEVVLRFHAQ